MKLLITTQKIDIDDPILGFFHRWIEEFAKQFEFVTVICLERGNYNLPANVKVLSLGKEHRHSRLEYLFNFYRCIWRERRNYDAVLVHMNQEYILLSGLFWILNGKKVFMWRNHHAGNFLTDLASLFCSKVFCTSKYSYTAKYKKTVLMPVGVDTEIFNSQFPIPKVQNSILFLGRIAPSKNVHIFVEVLGLLKKKGLNFSASIYGNASPKEAVYFERLKLRARELGLENALKFYAGIPNHKTPAIYNQYEIFVNLSSSGMYDKTIFEAMACGCLTLASNDNLWGQIDDRLIINTREAREIAECLVRTLSFSEAEKNKMIQREIAFANTNNLQVLSTKLYLSISS